MKRVFLILMALLMLSAFIFATGQVEKKAEAAYSLPAGVEALRSRISPFSSSGFVRIGLP